MQRGPKQRRPKTKTFTGSGHPTDQSALEFFIYAVACIYIVISILSIASHMLFLRILSGWIPRMLLLWDSRFLVGSGGLCTGGLSILGLKWSWSRETSRKNISPFCFQGPCWVYNSHQLLFAFIWRIFVRKKYMFTHLTWKWAAWLLCSCSHLVLWSQL